jgi:hypothetical protein
MSKLPENSPCYAFQVMLLGYMRLAHWAPSDKIRSATFANGILSAVPTSRLRRQERLSRQPPHC